MLGAIRQADHEELRSLRYTSAFAAHLPVAVATFKVAWIETIGAEKPAGVDERAVVRRKGDGPSLRVVSIGATDGDRSVPGIPVEMSTHPAAN